MEYGDYDLIVSLLTLKDGKLSAIAKSAKKSKKRFSGVLEPFSALDVVLNRGRGAGRLPVLQEAILKQPFPMIRSDFVKTAYASYWAELVNGWMEEGVRHNDLYHLLYHALEGLDGDRSAAAALSVMFQMRFIALSGYGPNLTRCSICRAGLDDIGSNRIAFDITRGGLVCDACKPPSSGKLTLRKGTVKQLLWIVSGDLTKAGKVRLDPSAIREGLEFLESFVPYHLGKEPRSLAFLRKIRSDPGLR